jgi:hypothetical protein
MAAPGEWPRARPHSQVDSAREGSEPSSDEATRNGFRDLRIQAFPAPADVPRLDDQRASSGVTGREKRHAPNRGQRA